MNNQTGYEISFEQAEAAKELVGKTLLVSGGRTATVNAWVGQNYEIAIGDQKATYPVVVILQQVRDGKMKVA